MTYTWLNPPVGEYTIKSYLEMHEYWMDSISASNNKLSLRANPVKKRFFGDKRVIIGDNSIILEEL